MELLEKIEGLIASGYKERFERLITDIESQPKLHKDLQKKLDEIGNTPIAEPELFKAIQEDEIVVIAGKVLEAEDIKKYKAKEVGDFLHAVKNKVTEKRSEDGTFKSTPNTENCILPNFLEAEELKKLGNEDLKLRNEHLRASNKEQVVIEEKINNIGKNLQKRTFEISGLDIEKLTEWEKDLITEQIYICSVDASLSALGKSLGN